MSRFSSFWRNIAHRDRVERELEDELRAVHDLLTDEKIQSGLPPVEARRAATLELGHVDAIKDCVRDARAGAGWDLFVQDVRYGARLLQRNPLFTLTAALSLAISIGANTTVFSLVNRLILRDPPGVAEPHRLVDIAPTADGRLREPFVHPMLLAELRQRVTLLEGVYGHQLDVQPVSLRGANAAERAFAGYVTTNYFEVLGVRPAVGRLFESTDREEPGASPIAVLSHAFWMRRFAGDPAVVGQPLVINGHPVTVVGVASEVFHGITPFVVADFWLPVSIVSALTERGSAPLAAGGRLKAGVSVAQAAAEVEAIAVAVTGDLPVGPPLPPGVREIRSMGLRVVPASPLPPVIRGLAAGVLALLTGLVSLVLLIACANLAGVLLARGAARRREIAVRLAIGAGRRRLVRQLLTETLLLCLIGGAAGLVLARVMASLLTFALPPLPLPVDTSLPLDHRVFFFTAALSCAAAVMAGLVPAIQSSRADVIAALKWDAQGPPDRMRLRHGFVVAQVALSVVLVVSAGLFVGAIQRAGSVDMGFDASGVETVALDLSLARYNELTGPAFIRELAQRARALPSVAGATAAVLLPRGGQIHFCCGISVPGADPPDGYEFFHPAWNVVEPGYFSTLRIPLLSGRDFSETDRRGAEPVAIVSDTAARQFWPGEDPVGKHMLWQQVPGRNAPMMSGLISRDGSVKRDPVRLTVVGVAGDVQAGPTRAPAIVYLPFQQKYQAGVSLVTLTKDRGRVAGEIHALVASMDRNLPVVASQALTDQISPVMFQLRLAAGVSAGVGIVGVLLAAIGIYGVTAYAVTRRTREIGIRIALGAQGADVVRMVLGQGMTLVLVGCTIGLALAAGAGRVFAHNRFGIPPMDPLTFAGAATLFTVVGLLACYVPVRRASRINAVDALRCE